MKKFLLLLSFTIFYVQSNAQGINASLGTGTEWVRLELGYSLNEQIHAGVRLCPGFNSIGIPSYYSGYIRKTFSENDLGWTMFRASYRGYIGGSLGLISTKGKSTYDVILGTTNTSKSRSALGFSGDAGVEILYGERGKFGSFFELNVGQVPNYFNRLDETISNITNNTNKDPKLAAFWGFALGVRIYFGK